MEVNMQDVTYNVNGKPATDSVIGILLSLQVGDSVKFNRQGEQFTLVTRYGGYWTVQFKPDSKVRHHHPLDVGWVAESVVVGGHTPARSVVVHKAGCVEDGCMGECNY
jgi:hypothetical protein